MHSGAIRVKNAGHLDLEFVLSVIIKKKGLGAALSFIVTRTGTDAVYVSGIGFRLGVDRRITVYLRGRSLKDFGLYPLGESQHIDGTMDIYLGGLHRIVLVMDRRRRTGQIVNFIHFNIYRKRNIVPGKFKIGITKELNNVLFASGVEIIYAQDVATFFEKSLT
jgi:hypothetical protein